MKNLKGLVVIATLSFTSLSFAGDALNAEEMLIDAEEANAAAAAIGFEWRDTSKFISEARIALADGKQEEAYQLAQRGYDQAVLAKKQGELMMENWEKYIPM